MINYYCVKLALLLNEGFWYCINLDHMIKHVIFTQIKIVLSVLYSSKYKLFYLLYLLR